MKPVLVGSRALEYWDIGFKCRENADWDILTDYVLDYKNTDGSSLRLNYGVVEAHSFDELNNFDVAHEYAPFSEDVVEVAGVEMSVMSLEGLALMKRSHLWRARMFDKHITMYHKYLAPYLPTDETGKRLLKERIKLTKEAYPQKNPSLKQTNEEFFDDAVVKKFDHDWIHELVAFYDRPLYERLKKEDGMDDAWCEGDLWKLLSYEDQNRCVAEECHVIACERFMIPNDWGFIPKKAYFMALNKVCTTLCSGWFRDHAIDNFPEILRLYTPHKFEKVRKETENVT